MEVVEILNEGQVEVIEVGIAGPQGKQGEPGGDGPPGAPGATFVFEQMAPSAVWTIAHGLGYQPAVTVVDSGGSVVEGEVDYLDADTVILTFSAAFGGVAYLS